MKEVTEFMTDGKKTQIGVSKYFADITAHSIFSDVQMTSSEAFSDCVTQLAQRASKALNEIYEDIDANSKTIKFLQNSFIDNIRKFSDNLYEIKEFASVSMRRSSNDIRTKLTSLGMKSGASMRDIEKACEEIFKKDPLKLK